MPKLIYKTHHCAKIRLALKLDVVEMISIFKNWKFDCGPISGLKLVSYRSVLAHWLKVTRCEGAYLASIRLSDSCDPNARDCYPSGQQKLGYESRAMGWHKSLSLIQASVSVFPYWLNWIWQSCHGTVILQLVWYFVLQKNWDIFIFVAGQPHFHMAPLNMWVVAYIYLVTPAIHLENIKVGKFQLHITSDEVDNKVQVVYENYSVKCRKSFFC